ncbi:hypothetical protein E8E12_004306 [Didymella heteroderae]|uniref:Uncharacterized protein n=1 Tax=Didymella heteroderae TaxID=1769908 RepID=A0A9P5C5B9_9PLEO|nr:hypothetical protein E8E12_004306 [Didymella heteroderae]
MQMPGRWLLLALSHFFTRHFQQTGGVLCPHPVDFLQSSFSLSSHHLATLFMHHLEYARTRPEKPFVHRSAPSASDLQVKRAVEDALVDKRLTHARTQSSSVPNEKFSKSFPAHKSDLINNTTKQLGVQAVKITARIQSHKAGVLEHNTRQFQVHTKKLSDSMQDHNADLLKRVGEGATSKRSRTDEITYLYTVKIKGHVDEEGNAGVGVLEKRTNKNKT